MSANQTIIIITTFVVIFFSSSNICAQSKSHALGSNVNVNSSSANSDCTNSSRYRRGFFRENTIGSIGVSAGQETFLGVPKFGFYKMFPIIEDGSNVTEFEPLSVYFGLEASVFVFFAGVGTTAVNGGISLGPFTLDNSLTYTSVSGPSGNQSSGYTTYNPKFGLAMGPIWFKAGPSFELSGDADWGDWFRVDSKPWNFELTYLKRFN